MTVAVRRALKAADLDPKDDGVVALVKEYARLMDDAVQLGGLIEDVRAELDDDDKSGRRKLARLEKAVTVYQTTNDLGPKLLAALSALGLTPEARAKDRGDKNASAGTNPLGKLIAIHGAASRKHPA
ncbi:hypothetical protein GA0070564_10311 [Micromonospora mirobrigensis]|uniref:Terminase small subunit actinomycetes phage-type domain-containing protein n=2 Tax=Micromonospora mirobrigensis TaxID=262898 RepID=A0A1C4XD36_9ACTN|nr:hypothetical protein GA0070564_10311 [Micromonospora mirobrigensis]